MQEIFEEPKIRINAIKQTDYTLYEEICKIIIDDIKDVTFIHNLHPKLGVNLNPQNNFFEENFKAFEISKTVEGKVDYICAPLLLHKANNLDLLLNSIRGRLNQNGIFCGNFFGLNNLQELGALLAEGDISLCGQPLQRLLPLIDIKTVGMILQKNGFKNIAVSSQTLSFDFKSLKQALWFLKENGESNCFKLREGSLLSGSLLKKILAKYQKNITLQFEVCFFSCLL